MGHRNQAIHRQPILRKIGQPSKKELVYNARMLQCDHETDQSDNSQKKKIYL